MEEEKTEYRAVIKFLDGEKPKRINERICAVYDESVSSVRKIEMTCLTKASGLGCDGTITSTDVAKAVNEVLSNIDLCELTETCKCEAAYATGDVTTKEKHCTTAKEFQTCLTKDNTTDVGCDGTPNDKVKTDVADKAVNDKCSTGGAGMLSQMAAFTFVIVLFNFLFKQ